MKKEITILEHVTTHTSATMHFTKKIRTEHLYIDIHRFIPSWKTTNNKRKSSLSLSVSLAVFLFFLSKSIFPMHALCFALSSSSSSYIKNFRSNIDRWWCSFLTWFDPYKMIRWVQKIRTHIPSKYLFFLNSFQSRYILDIIFSFIIHLNYLFENFLFSFILFPVKIMERKRRM